MSLNLAAMFGQPVQLADCDVEEPNVNLFLRCELLDRREVTMLIPEVDVVRCAGCGACSKLCQFHGIVWGPGLWFFPSYATVVVDACGSVPLTERPHLIELKQELLTAGCRL